MMQVIIGWVLPAVLALACGWVAASAWQSDGMAAARSRRSLLAAMLETAFVALALRLVVEWSPVTIWLWILSVAALAAATAGAVIRWESLPRTAAEADAAGTAGSAARAGSADSPAESKRGRSRRQPREPGTATLSGYAVLLAAAVAVSIAAG